MFVETHLSVPLGFDAARAALDVALADGGLVSESRHAHEAGASVLMRVGPRGSHGLAKQVAVHVLPARLVDATVVVPLRWEATGATGGLFPALDANLGLTAAGDITTVLSVVARYDPPLRRVGPALDRIVLHRAATATVDALLHEIVKQLTRLAVEDSAGPAARAHPIRPTVALG